MASDLILYIGLMALALNVLVGYLVFMAVREYTRMRKISKQPTVPIQLINEGLVEIRGRALPIGGRTLISPISRNPCIYYHVLVEEKITTRNSSKWITVHSKGDCLDLMVSDESGSVLVRPGGAAFKGAEEITYHTDLIKKPGPALMSFIEREGIRHKGIFGLLRDTLRYTERYVPTGGYLYILGYAEYYPLEGGRSYDQGEVPYAIRYMDIKTPFIISDRSERWLIERYRRKIIGYLTAAVMIFLIPPALYIFIAYIV